MVTLPNVEARYGSFSKRHMSPSASDMRESKRGSEASGAGLVVT